MGKKGLSLTKLHKKVTGKIPKGNVDSEAAGKGEEVTT